MKTLERIQSEINELTPAEYEELRRWFWEKDWEKWDRQIERDSQSGKLDFLIAEAHAEKEQGRLKAL